MIGAAFCLLDLAVLYHYNLASGAAIAILSVLTYVLLQFIIQREAIHGINDKRIPLPVLQMDYNMI